MQAYLPSLCFLVFCGIAGLAIVRLGIVADRLEAQQLARIQAAILRAPDPTSGRAFLGDVITACLLTPLSIGCLILAFSF